MEGILKVSLGVVAVYLIVSLLWYVFVAVVLYAIYQLILYLLGLALCAAIVFGFLYVVALVVESWHGARAADPPSEPVQDRFKRLMISIRQWCARQSATTWGVAGAAVILAYIGYLLIFRSMPITVAFRPALAGSTQVASIHNTSQQELSLFVRCENRKLHQDKKLVLKIAPGATKEIGWLQGWPWEPGQVVTLSHENYRTLWTRVP